MIPQPSSTAEPWPTNPLSPDSCHRHHCSFLLRQTSLCFPLHCLWGLRLLGVIYKVLFSPSPASSKAMSCLQFSKWVLLLGRTVPSIPPSPLPWLTLFHFLRIFASVTSSWKFSRFPFVPTSQTSFQKRQLALEAPPTRTEFLEHRAPALFTCISHHKAGPGKWAFFQCC